MTTKQTAPRFYAHNKYAPEDQFPERPPRDDMQNSIYRERPGHLTALALRYGSPDTILVLGDIPVRHTFQRGLGPQMLRYPDIIVAFGVDCAEVIARSGYAIDDQGKPPDFVLEIASVTTALNDYTRKREDYAAYGIPEYWRFDPTDGERYPVGLAGDRLVDGEYRPIPVHQAGEDRYWGHSDALDLDVCWEDGQLRWWDAAQQRYLLTHDEEAQGRAAAEAQRDSERQTRLAAEAQRDSERQTRLAAEAQRDSERQTRLAAEDEAARAEARIRQLEEELHRRSQQSPPSEGQGQG